MKPSRIITLNILIVFLFLLIYYFSANMSFFSFFKREYNVVLVMKTTERISEFWMILEKGAIQSAEDLGINIEITGPDLEDNIQQQISIMEEVIESRPDAIILAATDYKRLVPVSALAREKKIHLLTVDSFISSDDAECEIGTVNEAAGAKLGAFVSGELNGGDTVALISFVADSSPAIEREQGVRSALGNSFRILDTVYTNNNIDLGYTETKRLLAEYPELKAIAALNENSAVGAFRAVKESDRAGEILFVTFDSDLEMIQGLEDGIIKATLVQKPYNMGYLAVQMAYDLIRKKPVPPSIDTGSELITRDNMYDIKNQKLLFPSI
ncbi:MAG: substrate-binding domain-containing protein [Spirochaetales bacterium]|nr:substrate-binding domain-containing protein [Spirochaetales bacterium]